MTEKDAYPLQNIQTIFDKSSGSRWYKIIDCAPEYWYIGMDPKDKRKTAIATLTASNWIYHFMQCLSGYVKQALPINDLRKIFRGSTFHYMHLLFRWRYHFGKDFETSMHNLMRVFSRLMEANLWLKRSKYKLLFFQRQANFLRLVATQSGTKCDKRKKLLRDHERAFCSCIFRKIFKALLYGCQLIVWTVHVRLVWIRIFKGCWSGWLSIKIILTLR